MPDQRHFSWKTQQFPDVPSFRSYLQTLKPPTWVQGATLHHTWSPVPAQWRGTKSMESLANYYRVEKKWTSGPHLFLCTGAPNPLNDGIFTGTPLTVKGTHAGACNSTRWGIEIVGNFDTLGWSPRLKDLIYGVTVALSELGDFDPADTNGHRECLQNKSCPGAAINMDRVRRELADLAHPTGRYLKVVEWRGANVRQGPGTEFPVAAVLPMDYILYSDKTIDGEEISGSNQWAHFAGPSPYIDNPLGFVWMGTVQEVTP